MRSPWLSFFLTFFQNGFLGRQFATWRPLSLTEMGTPEAVRPSASPRYATADDTPGKNCHTLLEMRENRGSHHWFSQVDRQGKEFVR